MPSNETETEINVKNRGLCDTDQPGYQHVEPNDGAAEQQGCSRKTDPWARLWHANPSRGVGYQLLTGRPNGVHLKIV